MLTRSLTTALLLASALLAGCNDNPAAPTATAVRSQGTAAASTGAASPAWVTPALVSTENDPATAADASVAAVSQVPSVPILRFATVDEGKLYRGGLPSKAALAALVAMGIKTDIDLMGEIPLYDTFMVEREKIWAREVGLKFIQVKVPTGKLPFGPKISDSVSKAFLAAATNPANQPAFTHCLHGRDRTGTMVAVWRMSQDHFTNAKAFEEMTSFGFSDKSYPLLAAYVKQYTP